ncbi:MAG: phosphatidate cytidylyltransferase [Erysipelotrichaceae bacterium]|jgi:phosphatidate cytidylyltransferase|nr:phosphatidate cytidylyltransferase [Erysipelotrichaceae bacterium]
MKTRFFTALLIMAFIIPALLCGGWLLKALIAFIIIFGGSDFLSLSETRQKWPVFIKPTLIICVFIILLIPEALSLPMIGGCILLCLSVPVFTEHFTVKDSFLGITYIVFFYMTAVSFLHIYEADPLYIWYIIFATYLCDTAAYFSGYFFGKHKLNPRISPKKTVEGSVGGWIFGTIGSFLFGYYFLQASIALPMLAVSSAVLSIVGQIGDLAFSAMKRASHIKDFSNFLPGHGGVLDRLDSLVFNFICFNMIMAVITL